jgi:hypothetical protein
MSSIKNFSLYEWTGTSGSEAESKKATGTTDKQNAGFQYAGFTSAAAASSTESEERWYGLKWLEPLTHTNVANARVTKVHGTLQTDHKIYAGYTDTYATPKGANVASAVATAQIPSQLITSSPLTIDTYDATDEEYQFLVLQHKLQSGLTAFDPEKRTGDSGYSILEIAVPLYERDYATVPGGNDDESTFNNTEIDLYVVIDQGNGYEMQMIGCTENAISGNFSPEWEALTKGALQGASSYTLSGRNKMLTGNIQSLNGWNYANFLHASDLGDDGWYHQYQVSDKFKAVENIKLYMDTLSPSGRRLTIEFPKAVLRNTGDIGYGAPGTVMPFEISALGTVNLYLSTYLMDVHRFKVGITLT